MGRAQGCRQAAGSQQLLCRQIRAANVGPHGMSRDAGRPFEADTYWYNWVPSGNFGDTGYNVIQSHYVLGMASELTMSARDRPSGRSEARCRPFWAAWRRQTSGPLLPDSGTWRRNHGRWQQLVQLSVNGVK